MSAGDIDGEHASVELDRCPSAEGAAVNKTLNVS